MKASCAAWLVPALCLALAAAATSANDHIEEACGKASHKDLCISSLRSDPAATSSDLPGLAMIGIRLATNNAADTASFINQSLNDTTLEPNIGQCLADCSDYYLDAVQQLDDTIAALTVKAYADAHEWVETASEDVSSCEEGFRKQASGNTLLSGRNEKFLLLCDNALAMVKALQS